MPIWMSENDVQGGRVVFAILHKTVFSAPQLLICAGVLRGKRFTLEKIQAGPRLKRKSLRSK